MQVILARFGTPIQFGIGTPTTQIKAGEQFECLFSGQVLYVREIRTGLCVAVPTSNIAYLHIDEMPSPGKSK